MKKQYLIYLCLLLSCCLSAQEYFETLPENPDPNKCFAKCVVPDEYGEEEVTIMTKPEHKRVEIIPAEYENRTQEIVIRPASKRFVYVPAVYETVVDTLWIKDPYHKLEVIPTTFKKDFETLEVKPKTGTWVAGEKDPDCPSIDPADCRIFHFVERPAVVRDIPVQKIDKKVETQAEKITGEYRLITKQVEVSPAHIEEEDIPQRTQSVQRNVLVKDETTRELIEPAEYTTVIKKVLRKKGGMTAWREVPCNIPDRGTVLPIYYALGSAELNREAKQILDRNIYTLMLEDKSSTVEIGSHTDSRGGDSFNQNLSERRAKSVVEYLISKGISEGRLIAIGYGETQLLNDCSNGVDCNEQDHAENRRTEFKVF